MRKEFEMTEQELGELLEACKPTPAMLLVVARLWAARRKKMLTARGIALVKSWASTS
ncbi:hypothetical protein J8F10_03560 [Gemmata sp. G18]|uniref:Uncharacterized protein n=1 Tax=Gemmata palustris TaxID=2822762 RepID=A0ABS5BNC4_9BACT|nr:hypothetical protein [Gemmata palustris]MBP3954373.1 hypothetical protein [Gemmata palustris]